MCVLIIVHKINSNNQLSDPSLRHPIRSCEVIRSRQHMHCPGHRLCMCLICDLRHNSVYIFPVYIATSTDSTVYLYLHLHVIYTLQVYKQLFQFTITLFHLILTEVSISILSVHLISTESYHYLFSTPTAYFIKL